MENAKEGEGSCVSQTQSGDPAYLDLDDCLLQLLTLQSQLLHLFHPSLGMTLQPA